MVDVAEKRPTPRDALAHASLRMAPATMKLLVSGRAPKGDVLAAARIAGIQAAKRTWELIPLCHPIALTSCTVDLEPDPDGVRLHVIARARTLDRTGVEMEALTAVSVAALALFDMVKAADPAAVITDVRVVAKSGGRSGDWREGE